MKKNVLICSIGLFFFSILPFRIYAQNNTEPTPVITQTTVSQEIREVIPEAAPQEYILPYPGMLPDHVLYPLKQVRDFLLERLIADPVRKIEFHILQADKRLQMGVFLVAKGKPALAETSISKGGKYLYKSVEEIKAVKASSTQLPMYIVEKAEKSITKHREVIQALTQKISDPTVQAGLKGTDELLGSVFSDLEKTR